MPLTNRPCEARWEFACATAGAPVDCRKVLFVYALFAATKKNYFTINSQNVTILIVLLYLPAPCNCPRAERRFFTFHSIIDSSTSKFIQRSSKHIQKFCQILWDLWKFIWNSFSVVIFWYWNEIYVGLILFATYRFVRLIHWSAMTVRFQLIQIQL